MYGLSGILGLILQDSKSIEEMEMMQQSGGMMGAGAQGGAAGAMGGKNFTNLFKGEKDYYELVKYDQFLEDAEDAFLLKFS
jgi:hypothetical protein